MKILPLEPDRNGHAEDARPGAGAMVFGTGSGSGAGSDPATMAPGGSGTGSGSASLVGMTSESFDSILQSLAVDQSCQ